MKIDTKSLKSQGRRKYRIFKISLYKSFFIYYCKILINCSIITVILNLDKIIKLRNLIADYTKSLLKNNVFMLQKSYWKSLTYIKLFKINAWHYNL